MSENKAEDGREGMKSEGVEDEIGKLEREREKKRS